MRHSRPCVILNVQLPYRYLDVDIRFQYSSCWRFFLLWLLFICIYFVAKCHQEKHKNVHKDDSYNSPILPHQKPPVSSHMAGWTSQHPESVHIAKQTPRALSNLILLHKTLLWRARSGCFFLKKKRYIAYIYLFIYIRLHITVSLHLCLILSRLISQIKLVTFHFIVRFFFFFYLMQSI